MVPFIRLLLPKEQVTETAAALIKKAPKQASLLKLLATQSDAISTNEAKLKSNCDSAALNALVRKGLASLEKIEVRRAPLSRYAVQLSQPLNLTDAQEAAFKPIQLSLHNNYGTQASLFLLHGVTASGKTEIYLQALAEAIKTG